ncbi:MAG: LOG family protein, partial [Acidimicrobiia bacterium]
AKLLDDAGITDNRDLITELVTTSLNFGRGPAERLDLKIAAGALGELNMAYDAFVPFRDVRKLAIFGSARTDTDSPLYELTNRLAHAIVQSGWMVITGAGPGIMKAGIDGAGANHSFGVGIRLPFEPAAPESLAGDPKMVIFRYFFARKLTFVRESSGFAALPGGLGTLDEVFELLTLLQTGKTVPAPLVLVDTPDGDFWSSWRSLIRERLARDGYVSENDEDLFRIVTSEDEVVREMTTFYRNYHSVRFVQGQLVIRMRQAPSDGEIAVLERAFSDSIATGSMKKITATQAEIDTDDVVDLDRITMHFNRKHWVRIRHLIDRLNAIESDRI